MIWEVNLVSLSYFPGGKERGPIQNDTDYAIHDAIGDFYWANRELRLEYELGYKRWIKPYLALWVGGNAEKLWVFDSSHLGKSYSYSAPGGIVAIGLGIYPFTLLKSLFEEARVKEEMGKIEKKLF